MLNHHGKFILMFKVNDVAHFSATFPMSLHNLLNILQYKNFNSFKVNH